MSWQGPLLPDVPDVPELPVDPLEPVRPLELGPLEQRLALHGGEQQSSSLVHEDPTPTQTASPVLPSGPPSSEITMAHCSERQKLPCGQSVSIVQAACFLLHATSVRNAPVRRDTPMATRA